MRGIELIDVLAPPTVLELITGRETRKKHLARGMREHVAFAWSCSIELARIR